MAGEGYGTTGIGTGGAQVVGTSNYNVERYAQPLVQQQKEKAAKEATQLKRNDKILGDLKGLSKIGSLRYGAGMDKFRGEIIEKAKKAIQTQDINDLLDLENSKLQFNTIMDLAKQNDAFRNNVGQQMLQGGNYWNKEFFDEYHTPLDISNIAKPEDLIGQMTVDRDNLSQIRKDKHDPIKFSQAVGGIAKTFYSNEGGFTEDDLRDSLGALFQSDPTAFDTYKHYEDRAKQDKALLGQFNGDVTKAAIKLATTEFLPLVGKKPEKAKGGITINVDTGDKGGLQGTSKPVIQNVKIARGFGKQLLDENGRPTGEIDYDTTTESVPLNVVTLPNKVTLGTTVWPDGTIQVASDGTITDISGQPASKDTAFGQFAGDTYVATETVSKTVNGKKFTINAGEIVDPAKVKAFKETTGIDIPYKEQPIALVQNDEGYIYTASTPYGEPVGLSYMSTKGQTPKGQAVEKGIKTTNKTGKKPKPY